MRIRTLIPWIIVLILGYLLWTHRDAIRQSEDNELPDIPTATVLVERIEAMGKLELVKYKFQEITEVKELSPELLSIIKLDADSKAVLISRGEAVGCIDLTQMTEGDVRVAGDSVYVKLPLPELCYHKLDVNGTKLYSVETGLFANRDQFISRAYQQAEKNIEEAALDSDILKQSQYQAQLILRPLLEEVSGKTIIFTEQLPPARIEPPL